MTFIMDKQSENESCFERRNNVKLVIPEGVETIPERAFLNNCIVEAIILPRSLRRIEHKAFHGCRNLKCVHIPEGTVFIGSSAFAECVNLEKIVIPSSVRRILPWSFMGCTSLEEVKLHSKILSIEEEAFRGCSSLLNIDIPDHIAEIGKRAFIYSGLQSVSLPEAIEKVYPWAFACCENLTTVSFGAVKTICEGAFYNCKRLQNVILPSSLIVIEEKAFERCKSLTNIFIPEYVSRIGNLAFGCCRSLKNIVVDNKNYYFSDKKGVLFDKQHKKLIVFPGGRTGEYNIPDGTEEIAVYAFYECSELSNLTFPSSLKYISERAFDECTKLKEIVIPSEVNMSDDIFHVSYYGNKKYPVHSFDMSIVDIHISDKSHVVDREYFHCKNLKTVTIDDGVVCWDGSLFMVYIIRKSSYTRKCNPHL